MIHRSIASAIVASNNSQVTGGQYSTILAGTSSRMHNTSNSLLIGQNNYVLNSTSSALIGFRHTGLSIKDSYAIGGISNTLSGANLSTIIGGQNNRLTGTFGAIIGGSNNINRGDGSYIFGSSNLVNQGANNSLAIGNSITILPNHSGAAVISDGNTYSRSSVGANTLMLDFNNGIVINTSNGLFVNGVKVDALSQSFEIDMNISQNLTGLYV